MWKSLILQYALKAIGKGVAIGAGALAAKYGLDGSTADAINTAGVAIGGIILNEGTDLYQKLTTKKKVDANSAKVAIVANETNVGISPGKVAAAQTAFDRMKAAQARK